MRPLPKTWVKHLCTRCCIHVGKKLMPIVLLKGSRGCARGLAFHEWQSSNRKAHSCSLSRCGHRVHAVRGCPPSRSVCLSCWLGTVVWPFCLQERGQQPVSSSCCKNRVGKPERSFHSRTYYPGKKPARTNKPFLMKDHLRSEALRVRTQVTGKRHENSCALANFPSGVSIY